jgi:hypothetical protein
LTYIGNGEVGNQDLADDAVTTEKIQDGQVTSADVADGTITSTDLAEDAIPPAGGGTPDDNSVTSAKIADGAVASADIGDGQITTQDLANGAVTRDKIASGAIMPTIHIVPTAKNIVVTPLQIKTTTVYCPAGEIVTGGGFSTREDVLRIMDSNPEDADTWTVTAKNDNFIDSGSYGPKPVIMQPTLRHLLFSFLLFYVLCIAH